MADMVSLGSRCGVTHTFKSTTLPPTVCPCVFLLLLLHKTFTTSKKKNTTTFLGKPGRSQCELSDTCLQLCTLVAIHGHCDRPNLPVRSFCWPPVLNPSACFLVLPPVSNVPSRLVFSIKFLIVFSWAVHFLSLSSQPRSSRCTLGPMAVVYLMSSERPWIWVAACCVKMTWDVIVAFGRGL